MTIVTTACHASNLTWEKWLNQQLPPLFLSFGAQHGLRRANDEFVSASTIRWDLWPDVDEYIVDVTTKSSRHEHVDLQAYTQTREAFSEANCCFIYQVLLANIGSVVLGNKFHMSTEEVEEWSRSLSMMQQRTTVDINRRALNDSSTNFNNIIELARGNPEFSLKVVVKCTGQDFLVVGTKKPSFFRGTIDQIPPDLVKACKVKDLQCLDKQRNHILTQSITQHFGYLVSHKIGYEVISSIHLSYLVSRVDNSLRISEGIDWHHPRFIAAFAYFMEKTTKDTIAYVWRGGNGKLTALFGRICYCIQRQDLFEMKTPPTTIFGDD